LWEKSESELPQGKGQRKYQTRFFGGSEEPRARFQRNLETRRPSIQDRK